MDSTTPKHWQWCPRFWAWKTPKKRKNKIFQIWFISWKSCWTDELRSLEKRKERLKLQFNVTMFFSSLESRNSKLFDWHRSKKFGNSRKVVLFYWAYQSVQNWQLEIGKYQNRLSSQSTLWSSIRILRKTVHYPRKVSPLITISSSVKW